jgi:DNA-binding response OmpR family regulator
MISAKAEDTVLVVAADPDMLLIATAVLGGQGYRVLVATDADSAVQVLAPHQFPIAAAVIHTGIGYCKKIELECFRHGVNVHFMSGFVDEGIIRLRIPELASHSAEMAVPATLLS